MISVIIRTNDMPKFLRNAIASVKQQTSSHWQSLMMNDEFTDDTMTMIGDYQTVDDPIHLISKIRQGVSTSPNLGIEKMRGLILNFLHVNDQWLPHKLYQQLKYFSSHSDLGISCTQVEILN